MRVLKGLFLFLVVLLFFILAVLFQINFALKNTLLSEKFFSRTFVDSNMPVFISNTVISKISSIKLGGENTEEGKKRDGADAQIPDISGIILERLDKNWLEKQSSVLIKGLQAYIAADADKLPTIDIKPLKAGFFDGVVGEMMKREEVKKGMGFVNDTIKMLDKKYKDEIIKKGINDELIDKVMKQKEIQNFGVDREITGVILKKYSEMIVNRADIGDISKEILAEVLKDKLKIDNIKDSIDLNLLMEKAFKNGESPLAGIRNIVMAYKVIVFRTLLLVILLLFLIIVAVGFKPKSFLRWTAGGLISGGMPGAFLGCLGVFTPIFINIPLSAVAAKLGQQANSYVNLQKWIESFIKGYFKILLIQGVVLILTGIVFICISCLISSEKESKRIDEKTDGTALVMLSRVLVTLVLIALIPLTVVWGVNSFSKQIDRFNTAVRAMSEPSGSADLMDAVIEVTGADFLKGMTSGKEGAPASD